MLGYQSMHGIKRSTIWSVTIVKPLMEPQPWAGLTQVSFTEGRTPKEKQTGPLGHHVGEQNHAAYVRHAEQAVMHGSIITTFMSNTKAA